MSHAHTAGPQTHSSVAKGREDIAHAVLVHQLDQRLGALVQQRGHAAAQYKRGARVTKLFTTKNHRKDAEFDIGCARGMRNTRGKLSAAGLGIKERLVLAQTLAHGIDVLDIKLIGQKRKIVSLEPIGVQLDIGKPIALKPAARATAIQQDIARKVIAVDELLDRKHAALASFNKPHRALKVPVSVHDAVIGPRAVETLGGQSLKLRGKLAVRIVPNHHTAGHACGQRLQNRSLSCSSTSILGMNILTVSAVT